MLSLYSTAHSQRRAERGVARVKAVSCSDTDRFGTDTNTRRQRHTSLMLMLRPTPRCSRVPSAVRAAVHHTHEACHPCGSRLCTVLYVPSLVRLPRNCHPSRGQGYRDNPPRCTAVEHALKLVVEGQVASMTTSRDKRISPQRYEAPSASCWRTGLAERSVRTLFTQKCEACLWICSLKARRQVGATGRGNKRWSGYARPAIAASPMPCYEPSWHQERVRSRQGHDCGSPSCRRAWWLALNVAALARSGGRGRARAACPRRSRPQRGLNLLREPATCAGRTRPQAGRGNGGGGES